MSSRQRNPDGCHICGAYIERFNCISPRLYRAVAMFRKAVRWFHDKNFQPAQRLHGKKMSSVTAIGYIEIIHTVSKYWWYKRTFSMGETPPSELQRFLYTLFHEPVEADVLSFSASIICTSTVQSWWYLDLFIFMQPLEGSTSRKKHTETGYQFHPKISCLNFER